MSTCPDCGRVLDGSPCCEPRRRSDAPRDASTADGPFDLGEPEPDRAIAPVLNLGARERPRLVPPPEAALPAFLASGPQAAVEPEDVARPRRERLRTRLPAGIRLVIAPRSRRAAPKKAERPEPPAEPAPQPFSAEPAASAPRVAAPAAPEPATGESAAHADASATESALSLLLGAFGAGPEATLPPSLPQASAKTRAEPRVASAAPLARPSPPANPASTTTTTPTTPRPLPAAPPRPRVTPPVAPLLTDAPGERPQARPAPTPPAPRRTPAPRPVLRVPIPRLLPPPETLVRAGAVAAAVLLPPLLLLAALPLAAALLATASIACLETRVGRRVGDALAEPAAWAAFALALPTAAAGLLRGSRLLDLHRLPGVAWPTGALMPAALLGLGLACVAGLRLAAAGRRRGLAAAGVPALAALSMLALRPSPVALLPAAGALATLAGAAFLRGVRDVIPARVATWWAGAACAASLVGGLSLLAGSRRPDGLVGLLALASALPACALASMSLARTPGRRARRSARAVAWLCALAATLLVSAAASRAGASPATALAFALLVPLAGPAGLLALRRQARAHEMWWLGRDAKILGGALSALVLATALVPSAGASWATLAVAASAIGLACVTESIATARAGWRVAAGLAVAAATCATLVAVGLPPRWLPASAALALGALAFVGPRMGLRRERPAWALPLLAGLAPTMLGALAACALGAPLAGVVGVALAALAPLAVRLGTTDPHAARPRGGASPVGALHVAFAAAALVSPLLALGAHEWAVPALAAEALLAWLASRRWPGLVVGAAALCGTALVLVPLLTSPGGWLPGAVTLVLASALGASEMVLARSDARRGTGTVAAGLAVGAAVVAAAWLSAGALSPLVLLSAAVALAAMDMLTEDASLAWASRCGSTVAWCAGAAVILARTLEAPEAAIAPWLLAAASAVLVALLRRRAWPAFLAGLCASAALAAGCVSLGLLPLEHPALFLAPAGAWVLACGAVESGRGRAPNVLLAIGLVALAAGVLLEAHVEGAPPTLRWIGVALGAAMLACGVLSRHRVPVKVGAVALAIEGGVLAVDAARLVASHPLPGLAAVVAACLLAGAAAWRLAWRAGGRAALEMAWASDFVRLRESWSRWI